MIYKYDRSNLLAILPKSNPLFQNVILKVWYITGLVGYGKGAKKEKPCLQCGLWASAIRSSGQEMGLSFLRRPPTSILCAPPFFHGPSPLSTFPCVPFSIRQFEQLWTAQSLTQEIKQAHKIFTSYLQGIPTNPSMAESS